MGARFDNLPSVHGETVTVTTSGTPVQGSDINVPKGVELLVLAHPDNTGRISLAESSADALNTGSTSMLLEAGQSVSLLVRNHSNLWFDSTVSGDTVRLFHEFGG